MRQNSHQNSVWFVINDNVLHLCGADHDFKLGRRKSNGNCNGNFKILLHPE